jgi:hypothetical protein
MSPPPQPDQIVFLGGRYENTAMFFACATAESRPVSISDPSCDVRGWQDDVLRAPRRATSGPGNVVLRYPGDAFAPSGLKGQHFDAVALESVIDSRVGSQLYGIAFDDVEHVRVSVDGTWRAVPVVNNSFYLDLPGTANKSVVVVEATLEDGSVQVHDIQAGS